jgi:hypothetical protein
MATVVGKGGCVRLLRRHPGGHGLCSGGRSSVGIVSGRSSKGGGSGGGGNIGNLDAWESWLFATGPWGRPVRRHDCGGVVRVDGRIWLGPTH